MQVFYLFTATGFFLKIMGLILYIFRVMAALFRVVVYTIRVPSAIILLNIFIVRFRRSRRGRRPNVLAEQMENARPPSRQSRTSSSSTFRTTTSSLTP